MIDTTAERWEVATLICLVERNGKRAPKAARYKWTVAAPASDSLSGYVWVADGTAADVDGARLAAQNAAQDELKTQPATSPGCPHDAQESHGDVFAAEGQVDP